MKKIKAVDMAKKSSKSKPAKKNGRPTKYDPSMDQRAEDFLSDGYNRKALAAELDIDITTLIDWEKKHESFSKSIKRGLSKSERWFMDQVRQGFFSATIYDRINKTTESKTMNANVVALYARNVYGWDKKEEKADDKKISINLAYKPDDL